MNRVMEKYLPVFGFDLIIPKRNNAKQKNETVNNHVLKLYSNISEVKIGYIIVYLGRSNPLQKQSLSINDLNFLCRFSLERMSAK